MSMKYTWITIRKYKSTRYLRIKGPNPEFTCALFIVIKEISEMGNGTELIWKKKKRL